MIDLEHVSKRFGDGERSSIALDDVSLHVGEGEIFGVVGRSGAGKSTLLRSVIGLERPDAGSVTVDGEEITGRSDAELRRARHRIGMVFQHFSLLTNLTVLRNVEFGVEAAGVRRSERKRRALEMLDLVGLADRAADYPAQLSGGQRQRVGIARALAKRPSVLLSDEATSALDPATTTSVLDLLSSLNRELGLTILLITHQVEVVKRICTSAALMRDARIVEQGVLVDLLRRQGSELASQLFPLGQPPRSVGTVVDATLVGDVAAQPLISSIAREFSVDVVVLGAAVERVAGAQAGRIRLALTGSDASVAAAVDRLRHLAAATVLDSDETAPGTRGSGGVR